MANDYFPPDVAVRYEGDKTACASLVPDARNVLFKALLKNQDNPVAVSITSQTMPGGALITVLLAGDQKIITINVPPVPDEVPPQDLYVPFEVPLVTPYWTPLHGWFDTTTSPYQFMPSVRCAKVNALKPKKQSLHRLSGVDYANVYATQWTGAMKRVVQAIMGIGIITDGSLEYATGNPPPQVTRAVPLNYTSSWLASHGIVKTDKQNHWLIEISQANGVLAMPLPLFSSTTTAEYRAWVSALGDKETRRILDEFGGIPSGESFPTDSSVLNKMLADGRALQLLTSTDMTQFYGTRYPYFDGCGWAFSDSDYISQAHNTCFTYRIGAYAGSYPDTRAIAPTRIVSRAVAADSLAKGTSPPYTFNGEHWSIDIQLSKHTPWAPGKPVGGGGAELTMESQGYFPWNAFGLMWSGSAGQPGTAAWTLGGGAWDYNSKPTVVNPPFNRPFYYASPNSNGGFATGPVGCTLYAFFDYDRLEKINATPSIRGSVAFSYVADDPQGLLNLIPAEIHQYQATNTPAGFTATSYDARAAMGNSIDLGTYLAWPYGYISIGGGGATFVELSGSTDVESTLVSMYAQYPPNTYQELGYTVHPLQSDMFSATFQDTILSLSTTASFIQTNFPTAYMTNPPAAPDSPAVLTTLPLVPTPVLALPVNNRESWIIHHESAPAAGIPPTTADGTLRKAFAFIGGERITLPNPRNKDSAGNWDPIWSTVVGGSYVAGPLWCSASTSAWDTDAGYAISFGRYYKDTVEDVTKRQNLPPTFGTTAARFINFVGAPFNDFET